MHKDVYIYFIDYANSFDTVHPKELMKLLDNHTHTYTHAHSHTHIYNMKVMSKGLNLQYILHLIHTNISSRVTPLDFSADSSQEPSIFSAILSVTLPETVCVGCLYNHMSNILILTLAILNADMMHFDL